ncbi:MAG: thioredoxin domain-containing protein [Desulfarculaceae bacterium]|nr:thioredoxin domain-containing protein [Desulfarculaceae bacterium]
MPLKGMFSGLAALAALCLLAGLGPAWAQAPGDQAIRDYIKAHPEVILEALSHDKEALYDMVLDGRDIKQRRTWRANIKTSLAKPLKPKLEPDRPRRGEPKAPILVVEYSDFLCPSCARGARIVEQLLRKDPDKFQLILKHMPSGDLSRQLALYFEAIGRQDPGKAWQFYTQVFNHQHEISKKGLKAALEIVNKLNLDQARLARDLADPALAKRIKEDSAEGRAFNLGGTPAFVAAGVALRGPAPVEAFEDVWYISRGQQPPPLSK